LLRQTVSIVLSAAICSTSVALFGAKIFIACYDGNDTWQFCLGFLSIGSYFHIRWMMCFTIVMSHCGRTATSWYFLGGACT